MASIPISKVEQTVSIIRKAIQQGEWEGHLPSERMLSSELMVSRGCLRLALDSLSDMGVIAKAEPYKRRRILSKPSKARGRKIEKVIFFSPEPAHKASPSVLVQVAALRGLLIKSGLMLEMVSSPVFQQATPSHKKLEQLVKDHPRAVWILHQSNAKIQEWFSEHHASVSHSDGVSAIVFGSSFPSVNLPFVDFDMQGACRHAAGVLLAKGHRKICLLRFRSSLAGDDLAEAGMQEALSAHTGGADDTSKVLPPVVLKHNFHVERLGVLLDQTFSSSTPPTALIVINPHHFLASYTHLQSRGLKVPENVSMVCLTNDVLLDYIRPRPVSYSVDNRLIQKLAKMVMSISAGRKDMKNQLIEPEMVSGHSLMDIQ